MADSRKKNSSVVFGLYGGVILGALGMILGGVLDNKTLADLSLIMGLCAGPSIGWIVQKVQEKRKKPQDGEDGIK